MNLSTFAAAYEAAANAYEDAIRAAAAEYRAAMASADATVAEAEARWDAAYPAADVGDAPTAARAAELETHLALLEARSAWWEADAVASRVRHDAVANAYAVYVSARLAAGDAARVAAST